LPSRESEESAQSSPRDANGAGQPNLPPENSRTPTRTPRAHPSHHLSSNPLHPPHSRHGPPSHHSAQHDIASPRPRRAYQDSQGVPRSTHSPAIAYSQSQPLPMSTTGGVRYLEQQAASRAYPGTQLPYNYSPPAIIYAPSSKHSRTHYAPPAIVYSPPANAQMRGHFPAPGMSHSQSAPLPHHHHSHGSHSSSGSHSQHDRSVQHPHVTSAVVHEEPREMGREKSRGRSIDHHHPQDESERARGGPRVHYPHQRSRSRTPSDEFDDGASVSSGGTYYILPAPGQKVQVIAPNPKSLWTATSTTKSAHSPNSPSDYKKPFFQRIFHIPRFNTPSVESTRSTGSRGGGKRLQRRHTLSNAQNVPRQRTA